MKGVFSEFGTVNSCQINEKNNGTGFVSFSNHEEAQKAIDGLHLKKNLGEQSLIVAPHVYKKENELTGSGGNSQIAKNLNDVFKSNIFVKFIPMDVTKEEFTAVFSDAGKIASSKLEEHRLNVNGESFANY